MNERTTESRTHDTEKTIRGTDLTVAEMVAGGIVLTVCLFLMLSVTVASLRNF